MKMMKPLNAAFHVHDLPDAVEPGASGCDQRSTQPPDSLAWHSEHPPPHDCHSRLSSCNNDIPGVQGSGRASSPGRATALNSFVPGEVSPAVQQAFQRLKIKLEQRYSTLQTDAVTAAFELANEAHCEQTRSSGEPYILHPIAVADIVFDLELDHVSVMAALMHDVLEDTRVSRQEMVAAFGEEVTHIVDGVSKLTHLQFRSKAEAKAQSFIKMLLAMVTDIRVIIIKLADRTHNMRTIGALRPDKRRRIGRETLEVYAPIAHRLGMYATKMELENLGFRATYPMRSRVLEAHLSQSAERDRVLERVMDRMRSAFIEKGMNVSVSGREKHPYSVYQKMRRSQLNLEQIFDMLALRIIVDTEAECYQALGLVHQLYPPVFQRFKDYIAVPKQNGYQSLHTVLKHNAENAPLEVQIRTRHMHEMAEFGIAAHWSYKNASAGDDQSALSPPLWLARLADLRHNAVDSVEFVENVKIDLFPGEIYVFSPKGKIIQLPKNATPVDFAYAVHSEIGNKCVSALVDKRLVSLSTPLQSGETVEIITGSRMAIDPMWLNSVVTAKARTAIRHHLRALDRYEAIAFGQRLLRRALARYEYSLELLDHKHLDEVLAERRLGGVDDLFAEIGLGHHLPSEIAERLVTLHCGAESGKGTPQAQEVAPLVIDSATTPTLYMANCCRPVPGDNIQGFITPGKGVAVHRSGCRNVRRSRQRPREQVAVQWGSAPKGRFEVAVVCHLANQPGALASVTHTMSMMNVNIEHMDFNNSGGDDIRIRFVLSVENRQKLARIMRRLHKTTTVRSVKRER